MKNILIFFRSSVLGLFVISNAIICSVAVWNLSLAQSVGQNLQVDTYLTFLGAFALLFIFAIIFTEILRKNGVTGRLWFETLWVGLFWLMELSGAAALSAIAPNVLCSHQPALIGHDGCSSTRVLLAFTWMITIILFAYLAFLVCAAVLRQQQDSQIWHASVREFCRSHSRHSLGSAPNSPTLPRFQKELPDVVAPKPRHPLPTTIYAHHSGQGPEYDIGQYRPSSPAAARPVPPIPAAAPPKHLLTRTSIRRSTLPTSSLYPEHLHSSLTHPQASRQTPPPLGNWPRANAVEQPISNTRRSPRAAPASTVGSITTPHPVSATTPSTLVSSTTSHSRPTGPRTKSNSHEIRRPPPLDLTKISAFRSSNFGN